MAEEAPVAVTAATGALGPVVANLSTLLRRDGEYRYKLRRGTRKDIKLIRSKLKSIHSILWVIWEREDLDAPGKQLRMEAWRLADDMRDAIDDFILAMERSNDGKRFTQAKNQPSPFQDLKQRAVDVCERCRNRWKTESYHTTTFSSLFSRKETTVNDSGHGKRRTRVVDPYVHKGILELARMREPRDKLIDHLVGEEENTPQVKMACIVGAAGMGKTTLARLVYEAVEDKFEAQAFVSATLCRNMTEVLASILQQVAVDNTAVLLAGNRAATGKQLIGMISKFLEDKRYLVIIDDIWHCGEWETIKKSLPDNDLGSRIVTTSRVDAITNKWRDDFGALVHKIYHTSDREALDFTNEMMIPLDANIVGVVYGRRHRILDMCHGMPLAVACTASAMAKERERRQQQGCVLEPPALRDEILKQVTGNGIQRTPGFEPLVECFELGYNHLPHHMLKTCLLYCSIYPEGRYFKRDDLIRRWIAEGFVCKEEVAKDYFDELVGTGWLFQGLQSDPFEADYKLHPMMRNYLRQKLPEDNFITCTCHGVLSSPVGRLCINDNWSGRDPVDRLSEIDWHDIRSLVVFKDAKRVPYKHLQHLRVLNTQNYTGDGALENQHINDICGLLRLRHLLLSGHRGRPLGITEMPAEIARLQYLETLEVRKTGIRRLPAEMGDLKQLKTLDVSEELAELPREMEDMQHLETLRIRESKIRGQAWEVIRTLKKLKTLDVSKNHELSGIPSNIGELQELKNLDVSGSSLITELPWEIGKLLHLETLNLSSTGISELPKEIGKLLHLETLNLSSTRITELPKEIGKLLHLEMLNLSRTGITELPREIGNLQRLQVLDLGYVSTITKLPRDIGRLQHLQELNLWFTNVRKMPREIGELKKLKNLKVDLGILPFEVVQLPNLEGLPKCVRQAWKNSNVVTSLAGEILSFKKTDDTHDIGGLIVGTKHMHIPRWIKEHFNNIGRLDIRICKLEEEQDLKILREMPSLWRLVLRFEAVPSKPTVISSGGFAKLRCLCVDSRVPRITLHEGAMPELAYLDFEFQFYGGPASTDDPMGIKHLKQLEEVRFKCNKWYRADSPCIRATIDVVRKEAREHPNKIRLEVPGKGEEIFPANSITQSSQDGRKAWSRSSLVNEVLKIQA